MELLKQLKDNNYAIIASNGYHSYETGIKPVIDRLNENLEYFKDLIVADKIIGKASAMLLCLSKVKEVYCIVLSVQGKAILEKHQIPYHYETLTDAIINRTGDDICPMEKTVSNIDDLLQAYIALNDKLKVL